MANQQLYPVTTISNLFNMTDRRVQQLAKEGIIPKADRGKYDLIACVKSYIIYLQENSVYNGTFDLRGERARLTKEQADSQQLKNSIAKKEVAPISIIEFALSNLAQQVSSILESLPLKIKKKSPHLSGREIEEIRREIVKAQNATSKISVDFSRFTGSN